MRFQPAVDISATFRPAALQIGQWIRNGNALGQYLGITRAGSVIVAWHTSRANWRSKRRSLRSYQLEFAFN
jgi:hypothetical protein